MPSVSGILETALYVDDPQRSARFYQSLFGFTPLVVADRLVALAVREGQVLLLKNRFQLVHVGSGGYRGRYR